MQDRNLILNRSVDPKLAARAKELRQRMTPEEKVLWECLRNNRLDGRHFRRQQVIGKVIVDFYCHACGLVVEVDGPVHAAQIEADRERDAYLRDLGLHVLRIANRDINGNLEAVLERIRAACVESAGE